MKTIVFDFDGTIADTFSLLVKILNNTPRIFGMKKITESDIDSLRSMTSREIVKFVGLANWQLLPWLIYFRSAQSRFSGEIKLFPGITETLRKLKEGGDYQFLILSSNSKRNIEKILTQEKCTVFDNVYSESSLYKKDEALIKIAKDNGIAVSSITYVGDELRDFEACKRAGIPFIGVAWGYNTADALTTHGVMTLAYTVQELATIVEK